jgi:hypothetical protein
VLIQGDPGLHAGQQPRQPGLALGERQGPEVRAIDPQQIERIEDRVASRVPPVERFEHCDAILATDHRLAVQGERSRLQLCSDTGDPGIAIGPIMAAAGEQAHCGAVSAHHQPVAVVLDLVHPVRSGRRGHGARRNAWRNEPATMGFSSEGHASNLAACPIGRQPPDCRWEGISCELRTMAPVSEYPDDITIYLVVNDFGHHGRAFVETDIAEADRETVIRNFLSGQYSDALRVVAFNTAEGWSRDVSEDIAGEVLERAFDADDNLSEDTKRFIDRHMATGEKRPAAPSVRRATGADEAARVGRKTGA